MKEEKCACSVETEKEATCTVEVTKEETCACGCEPVCECEPTCECGCKDEREEASSGCSLEEDAEDCGCC